jgi:hypothetical protein
MKVFLEWITRLERDIETDGDYVSQTEINISVGSVSSGEDEGVLVLSSELSPAAKE